MKFSIGDNVVLKRTGEEGHVTAFIDKQMIEVEVNGTIFPVYLEDIDHPYLKWFTDKNAAKKKSAQYQQPLAVEKPLTRAARLSKGVYLSFLPVFKTVETEEVVDVVKVFLLNELPVGVKFVYDARIVEKSEFRHEGNLHAFGNLYIHSISYAALNEQPRFNWSLTDAQDDANEKEGGILRIRPAKLFEHISGILQGKEPSFNYLLIDGFKIKQKKEPPANAPVIRAGKIATVTAHQIEAPKYELDLHIEHLVGDPKKLSNDEISKIQMDRLAHYIQLAIVHRQERMVVIHGLGKGKLRDSVHAALKAIPEVARFKNEWSGKYGFGATEITFKR